MSDTARAGLTAALITVGLFAAATVGIIVFGRTSEAEVKGSKAEGGKGAKAERSGPKPKASKEGVEWNLRDLGDYLIAKGVAKEMRRNQDKENSFVLWYNVETVPSSIIITLHETAKKAKDSSEVFIWGRFSMWATNDSDISKIKSLLE
jgi:hypothetical protein